MTATDMLDQAITFAAVAIGVYIASMVVIVAVVVHALVTSHDKPDERPVLVPPVDAALVEDAEVAWLWELFPEAPSFEERSA